MQNNGCRKIFFLRKEKNFNDYLLMASFKFPLFSLFSNLGVTISYFFHLFLNIKQYQLEHD